MTYKNTLQSFLYRIFLKILCLCLRHVVFPCELSLKKTYLDVERLITVSSLCFFGSVLEHQLKKQISSCYECRERYSGVIAYCSSPLLPTLVLCPDGSS